MSQPQPNINPKEIDHFSTLAAQWWDVNGPMKPLHQINPLRLDFIAQYISLPGQSCLDVGCGGGILSASLAQAGSKVTAIDAGADVIQAAKEHARQSDLTIDYRHLSIEAFSGKKPEPFDFITVMELLEHVPQPEKLLHDCSQLLKPGGLLFLSTINRTLSSFLINIIGAEYLCQILPKGTHHYAQFIKPSEIAAWVEDTHLSVQAIKGIGYRPLRGDFKLHDGKATNYIMCLQADRK